jgi:phospholipid/cholesterol/gamma-HCH transport system substrate-binding protein
MSAPRESSPLRRAVRKNLGAVLILSTISVAGILTTGYLLIHERVTLPFVPTYDVEADLVNANGVAPGLGQPVTVSGVRVGSIVAARPINGRARVTLRIERKQLPHVYADARASLEPVTALNDMQLVLDPGGRSHRLLDDGGIIDVARTNSPVPWDRVTRALDSDTREFLVSLAASLQRGTAGRGGDMRAAMEALLPTAKDVRRVSAALAARRRDTAELVHELARLMPAAANDQKLGRLTTGLDATLTAIGNQTAPLEQTLSNLPAVLRKTRGTLARAGDLADAVVDVTPRLVPQVKAAPATLRAFGELSADAAPVLKRLRPVIRTAAPLVGQAARALANLSASMPALTQVGQVMNYTLNEYNYNPEKTTDGVPASYEGGLWGLAWTIHNLDSTFSLGDANAFSGRAQFLLNCAQLTQTADISALFYALTGKRNVCPTGTGAR